MPDADRRELERRAASGDRDAARRLLRELARAGRLAPDPVHQQLTAAAAAKDGQRVKEVVAALLEGAPPLAVEALLEGWLEANPGWRRTVRGVLQRTARSQRQGRSARLAAVLIGGAGGGKTALLTAIGHVLASDQVSAATARRNWPQTGGTRPRTIGGRALAVIDEHTVGRCLPLELGGETRDFLVFDAAGSDRYLGNTVYSLGLADAVVLVVAADEGVSERARERLAVARALGVRHAVVFVNACDRLDAGDDDLVVLLRDEVGAALRTAGFPADSPVLFGSATAALHALTTPGAAPADATPVLELIRALEATDETPWDPDGPLRLRAWGAFSISGRGTALVGRLRSGTLRVGDVVEVLGGSQPVVAGVGTLEVGRSRREAATAGEFVGAILRRARRWDLNKQGFCGSAAGLMATAPGGALPSRLRVALRTYVPGRASAPLRSGMVLQCFVGARRVGARLVLEAAPAEGEFEAVLELARPVFAERGDGVIVRRALPGEDASSPRRARWRSGLRRRQDWRLYRETAPRERSAHWTVATGRVLAVLDRER